MILELAIAALLSATPQGAAPDWSKDELKQLLARVEVATRSPPQQKDVELARTYGAAYRVAPGAADSLDDYSKKVLKKRDPGHPPVKNGQWLLALARRFYEDVAGRADQLSRFETDRRDRAYLEVKAREARAAAEQIAGMVQTRVEGGDGFIAPLPTAEGEEPSKVGVEIMVREGRISIDNLDRATFPGDAVPADIERTANGAVREIYAAQKNYNIRAETLGMVDKKLKAGRGLVRAFIPGKSPALYLNEIARGAKEAEMKTIFLMVHDPNDGKLRQIPLALSKTPPPKKGKKKAPQPVQVRCHDADTMQLCVTRAIEHAAGAPLYFHVD